MPDAVRELRKPLWRGRSTVWDSAALTPERPRRLPKTFRPGPTVLAFAALLAVVGGLLAWRYAAPGRSPAGQRDVPAPAECTVAPRALADPFAFFATPAADAVDPVAAGGPPADPVTVAEVAAVIRMERACLNANDMARVLALYTDGLVRRLYADEDLAIAVGEALVGSRARQPAPLAEPTVLLAVRDVTLLTPDRASAVVAVDTAWDPRSIEESRYVLVRSEVGWLIDEVACAGADGGGC